MSKTVVFLLSLLFFACNDKMEYKKMKPIKIELGSTKLNPTAVYLGRPPFNQETQLSTPNTFACDGKFGYGYTTISKDLDFTYEPLEKGFPGVGTAFGATPDGMILWGKYGYRGLYAIDRDTKQKLSDVLVAIDGCSEIYTVIGPFNSKKWVLVDIPFPTLSDDETGTTYSCYDMSTSNRIFRFENFKRPRGKESRAYTFLIPTGNDGELMGVGMFREKETRNLIKYWDVFTVTDTGFGEIRHNKLTQAMTEKNFCVTLWTQEIKRWDMKKRYIFGNFELPKGIPSPLRNGSEIIPAVVRWDEKMEDVTVSMLVAHIPKEYRIFGAWAVSPNGEWARCGINNLDDDETNYNCFFHLAESYPLGVSPPIIGAASRGLDGIFVEHDELGTLYIDHPAEGTPESKGNPILVYKMSEFFDALKAKTAEGLQN